jgi:Sugar (and other) transporter
MKEPHMRRANYAAAAVMISQQLCGINLIAFLSGLFFRNSLLKNQTDADDTDNYKLLGLGLGFGLVNFLATFFAAPYIDVPKKGRRHLLNLSFPLMAVSLLISGAVLFAPRVDDRGRAKTAVIAFHYFFLMTFTIVRVSELHPT